MVRLITGDPIGISGVKYLCVAIRSLVSPQSFVPKQEAGAFRLIHHQIRFIYLFIYLSVFLGIPRECCSVTYEDLGLCSFNVSTCRVCVSDYPHTFFRLSLARFKNDNQYFYDRCLPMWCSVSSRLFENVSCAVQWILTKLFHVGAMSHILDDFMFLSH